MIPIGGGASDFFAHNELLGIGASAGLVGIVALLGFLVIVGRRVSQMASQLMAASCLVCLVSGVVDFTWHVPLVLLTAGLVSGIDAPRHENRQLSALEAEARR
jgi:O-antigen ligase